LTHPVDNADTGDGDSSDNIQASCVIGCLILYLVSGAQLVYVFLYICVLFLSALICSATSHRMML